MTLCKISIVNDILKGSLSQDYTKIIKTLSKSKLSQYEMKALSRLL